MTYLSLLLSSIALFFTFRKDAHRIALQLTPLWDNWIEVLTVSNDSAFPVGILSIAYVDSQGKTVWLDEIGDHRTKRWITLPLRLEARSAASLDITLGRNSLGFRAAHGYLVQLESGRVYALQNSAPRRLGWKLRLASIASMISAGRYAPGVTRPRFPAQSS